MKTTIKQVAIFNSKGDKRYIPFDEGLNIITGDSKTGKSALIEIVDYCLFSSRSSIPKGKITDFASLFVVVFQVDEIFIVVGRPAADSEIGKITEAYLNIETDYTVLEEIRLDYFNSLVLKPIKNDVQTEFEEYLGLSLKQLESDTEIFGKLSIRDTVSFLFQHQNLVANKHAIFYRFDDVNKRKRVIEALPVLMGLVDEDYYELIKQKKQIERLIKIEEKLLEKLKLKKQNEIVNLRELIQLYYSLIGLTLEDSLSLLQLKQIGANLPLPSLTIKDQTKLYLDLSKFEKERELLYTEKEEVELSLTNLLSNNEDGYNYAKQLVSTHSKQKYNNLNLSNLYCPLCDNHVEELTNNILKLEGSKDKLVNELSKLSAFSKDNTQILSRLREKKKEIDYRIRTLSRYINELSKHDKEYNDIKTKRDKIIYQKGVIEATINNFLDSNKLSDEDRDLKKLQDNLTEVNKQLLKYISIKTFKESTEKALKEHMDRIAGKLDFEEELKPVNFYFNIDEFSFKHEHNGSIRLDEMGSGANWLACHISILIAFMHLNCENDKSVVPSFLMIDQPSQVYFPRTAKKGELKGEDADEFDDNIKQVRQIFKVLNEELDLIKKLKGFKPQIIVLEHANDNDFKDYIIRDWDKSKGQGLI